MCLYIDKSKHPANKPLVADRDIYTLKLVKYNNLQTCIAYFQNCELKYNTKLKKEKFKVKNHYNQINKGYHSIVSNNRYTKGIQLITNSSTIFDGDNFYFDNLKNVIVLCKIPKGTKYFIGDANDIVSETIILLQPIVVSNYILGDKKYSSIQDKLIIDRKWYEFYITHSFINKCIDYCKEAGYKIGL